MATIPLSRGYVTIVDDEDFEKLSQFAWWAHVGPYGKPYAVRETSRKLGKVSVKLHRFIVGAAEGRDVDHINGDTLDNRRSNLRIVAHRLNMANQRKKPGSSRFKGVWFHRQSGRWHAYITVEYRKHHLGCFASETDAALAYDEAARDLWGGHAALNFPLPGEQSCLRTA